MTFIASLPMYDLPEERDTVDALWRRLRDALRRKGLPAPESLVRRNADMPAVPGGIRDNTGNVIAVDPATLPPDGLDLDTLWRHPALLLGETCWGPLEQGLKPFVHVVAQNDYSDLPGGEHILYRSVIVERRQDDNHDPLPDPSDGPVLPDVTGRSFAFNAPESRSGYLALERDLRAAGVSMQIFSRTIRTGSHLASLRHVAVGKADLAAIDCRSWVLARQHQPALTAGLRVSGWTTPSTGLPLICSAHLSHDVRRNVAQVAQTFFLRPTRC